MANPTQIAGREWSGPKPYCFLRDAAQIQNTKSGKNGQVIFYAWDSDKKLLVLFRSFFSLRGGEELCQALILTILSRDVKKNRIFNAFYKHSYQTLGRCYLSYTRYTEVREMKEDCTLHPFRFIHDYMNLKRITGTGCLFVRATRNSECLTNQQYKSEIRPAEDQAILEGARLRLRVCNA